ncbi:hypothetical protein TCDM_07539 [Trypanosoma cruzi Dm28c]|uniref:Uncharacterized protein n=1 Tax=Trypanosoma cruzi Dm28c TaxID=1416333 RepID=V5DAA8_TRYCR|nr:hypothetical protein TCDM_07539 [Trypanosoma cruzi Dm28c]
MRFYGNDGPDNGGRNEFGATISSKTMEGTGNATIAWERHRRLRNEDAPETIGGEDNSSQLTDRDVDGAVADAVNEAPSDSRNTPNDPVTATRVTSGNCRVPISGEKERTGENGSADTLSETQQQQQQQQQHPGQHHSPIENVSLRFPSLSTLLDTDVSEGNEDLPFQGTVRFSESFTMPITVSDAEGLHSITLALDMMGKELKNALLAFEDMVQVKNY